MGGMDKPLPWRLVSHTFVADWEAELRARKAAEAPLKVSIGGQRHEVTNKELKRDLHRDAPAPEVRWTIIAADDTPVADVATKEIGEFLLQKVNP